ncbi:di-heme oxidoredictase family protein [Muricauda sp. 334s03]|uniref:Di-heme oxidoredictase family protein n=1 Tax=Flagellimonas yonaguniensis TaxID=3031325 RepID=A0ABT5Y3M4_9FLAO|nr:MULTISPECIES: di-heme oxidoredictase family protein [Allomuricauda]MAU14172.1 thiol oxidoreductase [Allomuricauda sp.]MBA4744568.1 c-type cytochrome [Allomuricauda sp.]MDF0718052.1 di-heme oxidoredictase family protein [[Muricauda] yonaguniensis]NDV17579.1 c-type cytochrome [Muricauda sp. TY007]|tara:strand:- start:1887 stop:3086 length:1200 start_codon:yes stop_codon:yes gene_type:complete
MLLELKLFPKILVLGLLLGSCDKYEPVAPLEEELLDGPLGGLTSAQNAQFLAGDIAFNDDVFTSRSGLGPLFVATNCASCHAGDGKGTPFTTLTRFGQTDATGNQFLHLGGPQIQNRALPGYEPETVPNGATFSKFTPPAVTGLGFLQYVTDADIMAMSDPNDDDGDGISGVPNWGTLKEYLDPLDNAIAQDGKYIHRFGKKAAAYDLLQQTVDAYNQDIGIASSFDPKDVYSGLTIDPEVSDKTIRDVVAYLNTLKAPIPRNQEASQVQNGKSLFSRINCASCHRPELVTGYSPIEALSRKTFQPYTDLLLHDMGLGLDDGYTEGSALTSEWRTPPLWGLGLSPTTQGGQYFLLHDGRAHSIEEAILMHGGEAENSKNQYQSLTQSEKNDLIKFLESL